MEHFAAWFSELQEGRGKIVTFGETAVLIVRQADGVHAGEWS